MEQEQDADYYGMINASEAGFNPFATSDVMSMFMREFPDEDGISFLKSHPKSLMRLGYAHHVNTRPMPGHDTPMSPLNVAVPGASSAESFQEAVMAVERLDDAKIPRLIECAANLWELELLSQRLKDLVIFQVARSVYDSVPWSRLVRAGADEKEGAFWSLRHFIFSESTLADMRNNWVYWSSAKNSWVVYDKAFPGILGNPADQPLKVVKDRGDALDAGARQKLLDIWPDAQEPIAASMQKFFDGKFIKSLLDYVPSLSSYRALLEGGNFEELFYRMAWIASCEAAFSSSPGNSMQKAG